MSTLYDNGVWDNTSESVSSMVEAFLYRDTAGPQAAPEMAAASAGQPSEEKPDKADSAPRISQEEISRLVAEAHAAGLELGKHQAATGFQEELVRERKRIADLISEFQRQCADYYAKVEIELVHLALAIAAKILHRESQVDRMVVAGLVKVMLERFQQNTNVVVRLRPEDAESWRHYFRDHANLKVVEDFALEPKACLLETELGVANLGLDAQLKEVEQGFFDLLARRPESK
ncbi:MAG: FliH/SctL family protein [Candidatus Sulfotelmatobacter sp.]